MRLWTHDELHDLIDNTPALKEKSDATHALPQISSEERERGKLQMMEIYVTAVNCKRAYAAREYVNKVFAYLRRGQLWSALSDEYTSQKLCHSPAGNDYVCFCDERSEEWIRFYGKIVAEDEIGITLEDTEGSEAVLQHKKGDYRKDGEGNVEVRIGSRAEFLKHPKGCEFKNCPKK